MKTKQYLLPVLTVLLLASCATDTPSADRQTTAVVTEKTQMQTETAADDRTQIPDGLPADLDFEGRSFGIYVYEEAAKYTIGLEDAAGDIVNDAVIARNIDLIHDTITTNFIYAYNYALNAPGKKQTR